MPPFAPDLALLGKGHRARRQTAPLSPSWIAWPAGSNGPVPTLGGVTGLPTLVVVSGPGGAGKTTLAHALAEAVGCPVISRDEIKEGMVHARPGFLPAVSDEILAFVNGRG